MAKFTRKFITILIVMFTFIIITSCGEHPPVDDVSPYEPTIPDYIPETLKVSFPAPNLEIGDKMKPNIISLEPNVDLSQLNYVISNPAAASVDSNGEITGIDNGIVQLQVSYKLDNKIYGNSEWIFINSSSYMETVEGIKDVVKYQYLCLEFETNGGINDVNLDSVMDGYTAEFISKVLEYYDSSLYAKSFGSNENLLASFLDTPFSSGFYKAFEYSIDFDEYSFSDFYGPDDTTTKESLYDSHCYAKVIYSYIYKDTYVGTYSPKSHVVAQYLGFGKEKSTGDLVMLDTPTRRYADHDYDAVLFAFYEKQNEGLFSQDTVVEILAQPLSYLDNYEDEVEIVDSSFSSWGYYQVLVNESGKVSEYVAIAPKYTTFDGFRYQCDYFIFKETWYLTPLAVYKADGLITVTNYTENPNDEFATSINYYKTIYPTMEFAIFDGSYNEIGIQITRVRYLYLVGLNEGRYYILVKLPLQIALPA